MSRPPKLRIVEAVTREHGERFADDWRDRSMAMLEAFDASGVVKCRTVDPRRGGITTSKTRSRSTSSMNSGTPSLRRL